MRLGRLIIQLCGVLIAGAILFGGYVYYRERGVEAFERDIKQPSLTLGDLALKFRLAPPAVCRTEMANFEGAIATVAYHYNGRARLRMTDLTTKQVTDEVVDDTGIYMWSSAQKEILFIPVTQYPSLPQFSIFAGATGVSVESSDCEVWWNPDESVFSVPANMPLVEYSAL